jgi:hypothetical protein
MTGDQAKKAFMLAIIVMLFLGMPANAQKADSEAVTEGIYVCKQLHAVKLGDDGQLNRLETANLL